MFKYRKMSNKTVVNLTSALGSLMTNESKVIAKSASVKPKTPKGLEALQKRASQAEANWYGLYHRKLRLSRQAKENQAGAWRQGHAKQANKATDLILRSLSGLGTKATGMTGRGGSLARGVLGEDLMQNMRQIGRYINRKDTGTLGMKGLEDLTPMIGAGHIAKNIAMSPLGIGAGVAGGGMIGANLLGESQGVDQVAEGFGSQPWYKQLMTALSMVGSNPDDIRKKISDLS